jgi:phosphoglycerol transferase MdoB-like AlkP superfamily enzyme
MREPFFLTFVAQSAHEPFDVPMETVIPGNDEEHQFLNSAYYADRALGDFIRKAKGEEWWRRTLVVIIADHGGRHPGNTPYTDPARYRVPMLWLGGALSRRSTVVDTYCSQSDVAYSLLRQLRIEPQGYRFSQDIFAPGPSPFGFYVFNDGFGLFERSGSVIFDNVGRRPLALLGSPDEGRTRRGQAFMQVLSTDLADQ